MPEKYGGAGLGITEASLMMQAVAESGAGMSGASALHMNIFGLKPVEIFGDEEQRQRFLPPLIAGKEKACFAVTEPDVGLDTTKLKTKATPDGNGYIVNGTKVWTSTAQVAKKVLLLTRTTDVEDVRKPTEGLDGMNPERILIAAEAIGIGRAALNRATQYAKDRVVFGRPIGKNQGIQNPLAKCWAELEAANLMTMKAAALFDSGQPCGPEANAAKYLAAEAGFEACQTAIMTHGGFGYAKEYQVERYLREVMIARIAPISPQLVLSFLAEKVLGLPKSY